MQENVDEGDVVHFQDSGDHENSPPLANQMANLTVEQGKS